MKQNRFTIFLKNGYYRTVFGYSMKEAIVKGLSWAYEYGYEPTIERIEEEIEEGDIIVKTIYIDIACNVIAFKLKVKRPENNNVSHFTPNRFSR